MGDLVSAQRAPDAGMLRPPVDTWFEEGTVDYQLAPAGKEIEQTRSPVRPFEHVLFLHLDPRHAASLGRQRVTRACQRLLLYQEQLACSLPFLRPHNWRRVHGMLPFFRDRLR